MQRSGWSIRNDMTPWPKTSWDAMVRPVCLLHAPDAGDRDEGRGSWQRHPDQREKADDGANAQSVSNE